MLGAHDGQEREYRTTEVPLWGDHNDQQSRCLNILQKSLYGIIGLWSILFRNGFEKGLFFGVFSPLKTTEVGFGSTYLRLNQSISIENIMGGLASLDNDSPKALLKVVMLITYLTGTLIR